MPPGLDDIVAISSGMLHFLALRSNGTVVAVGDNSYSQSTVPPDLTDVIAIAAGLTHSLAGRTLEWLTTHKDKVSTEARSEMEMRIGLYSASVAYYQGDIDTFIALLDAYMNGLNRFPSIVKVVNLGEALLYRGPIGFGGRLTKMADLSAKVSVSDTRKAALHQALQGHGFVFFADLYYEWNRLVERAGHIEAIAGLSRSRATSGGAHDRYFSIK